MSEEKKTYDILDLQKMDFLDLIKIAGKLDVQIHKSKQILIYDILDKQFLNLMSTATK